MTSPISYLLAMISCDSLSCRRLMLDKKASRELIPTTFPKQSKLVSPSASAWYWLFVHQRKYKNSNVYAQKRIYAPFQDLTFLFVAQFAMLTFPGDVINESWSFKSWIFMTRVICILQPFFPQTELNSHRRKLFCQRKKA